MIVIAWLVIGAALLFFELHHMAFYAFFAGIGAIGAAIVALFLPDLIALQAIVAVLLTVVGVVAARPWVSRVFHHQRAGGHVARGVHGGLVGQEAIALDDVGDLHSIGHVRLAGERWLATTGGTRIPAGTSVIVTEVRGTTLVVWPVDELDAQPPAIGPPNTDAPNGADRS
jgi:membrane protein implicated in regulation of membrane protease activity